MLFTILKITYSGTSMLSNATCSCNIEKNNIMKNPSKFIKVSKLSFSLFLNIISNLTISFFGFSDSWDRGPIYTCLCQI